MAKKDNNDLQQPDYDTFLNIAKILVGISVGLYLALIDQSIVNLTTVLVFGGGALVLFGIVLINRYKLIKKKNK